MPEMTAADRREAAELAFDHDDVRGFWAVDCMVRDATFQAARDASKADDAAFGGAAPRHEKQRYDALSDQVPPAPGLERLRKLSDDGPGPAPDGLEPLLAWLEEDTFARSTGYEKQTVLRTLRRFTYDEPEATVLRRIILAVIQRGPRQEFREVRRLARCVDSAEFRADLARLAASEPKGVAERARLTLGLCQRRPLPA